MHTLDTIAARLGISYNERAEQSLAEWQASGDIARRETALTPADCWPGKNVEARDAARDAAFAADPALSEMCARRDAARARLMTLAGQIEELEAARRAAEWSIRARTVDALERRHVQANTRGDRVEQATDDWLQSEVDTETADVPF